MWMDIIITFTNTSISLPGHFYIGSWTRVRKW